MSIDGSRKSKITLHCSNFWIKSSGRLLVGTSKVSGVDRPGLPCSEGSFSSSLRSVGWNRDECVFRGDFIASARGTSLGIMERRSKDGPLARPLPMARSPGIVSTAPGGGGCCATVSKTLRERRTTGEEVTTTDGGAGDGEAFRGGVCARAGDAGCGTGNGFSFFECLSCLSLFFDSLSGEAVPEADALFLSPLSFLCRLSYTHKSILISNEHLQT